MTIQTKRTIFFGSIAALLLCASTIPEEFLIASNLDKMALNVCWKRYFVIFPQRWSCESMIKTHFMAIAFGCALKNDSISDICEEFDKVKNADTSRK